MEVRGGMTTTRRTFEATATREGRWWIITVPELDAVTQARNVRDIDDMATGLVVALLDLDETEVDVNVTIELPRAVSDRWQEAAALHARAEADELRAATLRREALRDLLVEQHLTQVDAATILGLSPQRVQQLARLK